MRQIGRSTAVGFIAHGGARQWSELWGRLILPCSQPVGMWLYGFAMDDADCLVPLLRIFWHWIASFTVWRALRRSIGLPPDPVTLLRCYVVTLLRWRANHGTNQKKGRFAGSRCVNWGHNCLVNNAKTGLVLSTYDKIIKTHSIFCRRDKFGYCSNIELINITLIVHSTKAVHQVHAAPDFFQSLLWEYCVCQSFTGLNYSALKHRQGSNFCNLHLR